MSELTINGEIIMKTAFLISIFFCAIALPTLAELTPQDLDKIRLIVKEEVKAEVTAVKQELKAEITAVKQELKADITATHTKIEALDARFQKLEQGVSWVRGKLDNLDRVIHWVMALILVAIGIPQVIVAWRSRKERAQEKRIEELAREIETLKRQQIVNP